MSIRNSMFIVFLIPVVMGSIVVGVTANHIIHNFMVSLIIGWLSSGLITINMIILNSYSPLNLQKEC